MAVYVIGCVLEGLRYAHEFAIDGRCLGDVVEHRPSREGLKLRTS